MGRRLRRLRNKIKERREKARENHAKDQILEAFGDEQPRLLKTDIRMISGCEDHQTSADVSNVS